MSDSTAKARVARVSSKNQRAQARLALAATEGAAAKTLDLVPAETEQPGAGRRVRTPLALVTSPVRRRRAPLIVVSLLTLLVALGAVLMLNISVSSSQYELVALKNQQTELDKTNQSLTQQDQNQQAPQNVASKAKDLGMVPATNPGQINVQTQKIAGNPTPAVANPNQEPLIAGPETDANGKPARAASQTSQPAKAQVAQSQPNLTTANSAQAGQTEQPATPLNQQQLASPEQRAPSAQR